MAVESTIGKQIREVLATSLKRDPASVKPEHSLREDLGLDSLMTFELLYDLEKAFDIEIPNDDLPGLLTLADVVTYVEGRMSELTQPVASKSKTKKPATPKTAKVVKSASTVKKTVSTRKTTSPAKAKKPALAATTKARKSPTTSKSNVVTATKKRAATVAPTKESLRARRERPCEQQLGIRCTAAKALQRRCVDVSALDSHSVDALPSQRKTRGCGRPRKNTAHRRRNPRGRGEPSSKRQRFVVAGG